MAAVFQVLPSVSRGMTESVRAGQCDQSMRAARVRRRGLGVSSPPMSSLTNRVLMVAAAGSGAQIVAPQYPSVRRPMFIPGARLPALWVGDVQLLRRPTEHRSSPMVQANLYPHFPPTCWAAPEQLVCKQAQFAIHMKHNRRTHFDVCFAKLCLRVMYIMVRYID